MPGLTRELYLMTSQNILSLTVSTVVCITDLDKLNMVKLCNGGLVSKLEPIFDTSPAASKKGTRFERGQK